MHRFPRFCMMALHPRFVRKEPTPTVSNQARVRVVYSAMLKQGYIKVQVDEAPLEHRENGHYVNKPVAHG